MGTYVNTDSLALLAAAMILYAWASYLREDWTWKNCILLAVGMAVCALSYYNAYGWILCSFSSSVLRYYSAEKKLFHREFVSFSAEEQ